MSWQSRHTFCKGPRLRKINPPTHRTHRTHRVCCLSKQHVLASRLINELLTQSGTKQHVNTCMHLRTRALWSAIFYSFFFAYWCTSRLVTIPTNQIQNPKANGWSDPEDVASPFWSNPNEKVAAVGTPIHVLDSELLWDLDEESWGVVNFSHIDLLLSCRRLWNSRYGAQVKMCAAFLCVCVCVCMSCYNTQHVRAKCTLSRVGMVNL